MQPTVVTRRLRAMGIRDKLTTPASPWQNGFAERLIGSIRRECLDHSKAEDSKLRTADRLANLMAVFCILSRRVLWRTMLNRTNPNASPTTMFTGVEISLLDALVNGVGSRRCRTATLGYYLTKLARLGGYLARASDPPPGNIVIWRGLSKLTDIELGAELSATKNVGN